MAKASGGTRSQRPKKERNWYEESLRLKTDTLKIADSLKGNPMRFSTDNKLKMEVEMTKSDLKTIVNKATSDNKFNAIKNKLAQDIPGFIKKGTYVGWREVEEGKHPEAAYFSYYSRSLGAKAYLCLRKMRGGVFKPYAIINQTIFEHEIGNVRKDKPPE